VFEIRHPNRHFIIGVLVLLLGFVLLLDQFGFVEANKIFLFWPLILIYFGVHKLAGPSNMVGRFWGGFLILLGVSFELEELGISHIRFETIWPVFLICVGVLLILRRYESGDGSRYGPPPSEAPFGVPPPPSDLPPSSRPSQTQPKAASGFGPNWAGATRSWSGAWQEHHWTDSSAPQLNDVNIFWGGRRRIVTKNFMGGEIITIFGGFEIDLREADFEGDAVQIEIVTIFGGGEIRVPTNWSVVLETIGIFGGTTDRTRHPDEPNQVTAAPGGPAAKKLIIKGVSIFGGLNVKN
jgi:Cell wall-active antibiotics response 4TMS YvqF/Domain of unknown function (DUF5668)